MDLSQDFVFYIERLPSTECFVCADVHWGTTAIIGGSVKYNRHEYY